MNCPNGKQPNIIELEIFKTYDDGKSYDVKDFYQTCLDPKDVKAKIEAIDAQMSEENRSFRYWGDELKKRVMNTIDMEKVDIPKVSFDWDAQLF